MMKRISVSFLCREAPGGPLPPPSAHRSTPLSAPPVHGAQGLQEAEGEVGVSQSGANLLREACPPLHLKVQDQTN